MDYGLVVQSRLSGDLLVGDPTLLAEDAGGVVLADRGSGWRVWVAGGKHLERLGLTANDDGLSAGVARDADEELLACPSGRLVVGSPAAVAAWGPDVTPEPGLVAQARAYGPRRRHLGLVVVAALPSPAVRVRPVPGGWVAEPVAVAQLALGV